MRAERNSYTGSVRAPMSAPAAGPISTSAVPGPWISLTLHKLHAQIARIAPMHDRTSWTPRPRTHWCRCSSACSSSPCSNSPSTAPPPGQRRPRSAPVRTGETWKAASAYLLDAGSIEGAPGRMTSLVESCRGRPVHADRTRAATARRGRRIATPPWLRAGGRCCVGPRLRWGRRRKGTLAQALRAADYEPPPAPLVPPGLERFGIRRASHRHCSLVAMIAMVNSGQPPEGKAMVMVTRSFDHERRALPPCGLGSTRVPRRNRTPEPIPPIRRPPPVSVARGLFDEQRGAAGSPPP